MKTDITTPQKVFYQPQRLIVPLFQRPYVWNKLDQWEPLWSDVERVAKLILNEPKGDHYPHFLGAVVLQQSQNQIGTMQERTIIDGQQRLTTLQIFLDALHAELIIAGAELSAKRLEPLIINDSAFRERPEDQFKVWPTNRDRAAFGAVMAAKPPVAYTALDQSDSRILKAHQFFSKCAHDWLHNDAHEGSELIKRAEAIERAVREMIQMVVIELTSDENAQEIFETLNARGAQLGADDLIKNFIFQRLAENGKDVEAAYREHWEDFETGFYGTKTSKNRAPAQRTAAFLNHWLIAKTGKDILAREVFFKFKRFALDSEVDTEILLQQIHKAARTYHEFESSASQISGKIDRRGLFAYRTGVMDSEAVKPILLFLYDPDDTPIPEQQIHKTLDVIESWLVRRMLVRAPAKSYTQIIANLIHLIRTNGREAAGDITESYLREQRGGNSYWPDDSDLRSTLESLPAYLRLSRARLRMVLEAIEDYERGCQGEKIGLGGERVTRSTFAIEHIMPRKWHKHWGLPKDGNDEEREALLNTLGNLTLLTRRLNSKISNGPWNGNKGKMSALKAHDVLFLNRELLDRAKDGWSEDKIKERGDILIEVLLKIWPVPDGHRNLTSQMERPPAPKVELVDLINAGLIEAYSTLYAKPKRLTGRSATVLPEGTLEIDGVVYPTPSEAATKVAGLNKTSWSFWLVDRSTGGTLHDALQHYLEQRGEDSESDAEDNED